MFSRQISLSHTSTNEYSDSISEQRTLSRKNSQKDILELKDINIEKEIFNE